MKFDISYLGLFTSLIDVNSFYDKDYKIKDEYFSGFLKQNNNFSKISGIDMIGYIDPQLVFNSYIFLKGQKYEYPYFDDLNNYIEENLNCDFIKSGVASLNPEDNYYGIYLSELSKYTYEKQQMIPFMLQQYRVYEEKFSSKVDSDSLRNIYFTAVSLRELGQNIEKLGIKQETVNSITDYFSNLKYTGNIDEQQKNLSDFYYSYSLLNLVKVNISDTIISKVYKSISKYNIESSDNIDMLFYLYYLLDNIHNSQEISAIKDKISIKFDALCFNSEGNSKFIGRTLSIDDMYKALRIIDDTSGLTPNKKQKIREYLFSSIKKRHIEVFEFSNESTTLRAVYYAYLISRLC